MYFEDFQEGKKIIWLLNSVKHFHCEMKCNSNPQFSQELKRQGHVIRIFGKLEHASCHELFPNLEQKHILPLVLRTDEWWCGAEQAKTYY